MKNILTVLILLFISACGGDTAEQNQAADAEHDMGDMADATEVYSGQNADLVAEFNASAKILTMAINGISADQWTYRESDDRWNIAEVCEHIIMAEQGLVGGFVMNLVTGETGTDNAGGYAEMDAGVRAFSRDRSNPVQTTEQMEPKGIYATPEEALAAFEEVRAGTLEFLKTTDADFRSYSGTITPEIDPMDAHQWLLFAAGHVERHSAQIEQVKADDGYPAM